VLDCTEELFLAAVLGQKEAMFILLTSHCSLHIIFLVMRLNFSLKTGTVY
jgi:hypothetical protein